ncbi:hypothetical protein ACFYY1_42835 [Streptomyces sp. NPDC001890]|uniref:hypothetical protein n=1 Tax=Streptomyces sp. NPDC001890 TaxID=3364620 RepID=UPI003690BB6E
MDAGWATVVGAVIGTGGAVLGAVGGFLAGKAQAKGTVEGVRLQLAGQRLDMQWQARRDACGALIGLYYKALLQFVSTWRLSQYDHERPPHLVDADEAKLQEALGELRQRTEEVIMLKTAYQLTVPPGEEDKAEAVRLAYDATWRALAAWNAGRLSPPHRRALIRQEFEDALASYRASLAEFTAQAQQGLAHPHSAAWM